MGPSLGGRRVETWHHGIVARWWAEGEPAGPDEVERYARALREAGGPALEVGCGTGRLLAPLLEAGFDVDGTDVSADMLAYASTSARAIGAGARLLAQAAHELEMARRYRAIVLCGVFGLGGDRAQDREAILRCHDHLLPGGTLIIEHELPWTGHDASSWARWLPGHRDDMPRPWPVGGDRRSSRDGDELELLTRLVELHPLEQWHRLEIWARLWREGSLVREESATLRENLYFVPEIVLLLQDAGFEEVRLEAGHTGRPATDDDPVVLILARRPGDTGAGA